MQEPRRVTGSGRTAVVWRRGGLLVAWAVSRSPQSDDRLSARGFRSMTGRDATRVPAALSRQLRTIGEGVFEVEGDVVDRVAEIDDL